MGATVLRRACARRASDLGLGQELPTLEPAHALLSIPVEHAGASETLGSPRKTRCS